MVHASRDKVEVVRDDQLDPDGFLSEMVTWSRDLAHELAERNEIGPLTEEHWKVIEFVREFYLEYGYGPTVVKIAKGTGLSTEVICTLFECGVARGAYRLAGLPRPSGCL